MSSLNLQVLKMTAAELGPENPLPPLLKEHELHIAQSVDPAVPSDIQRNMNYGHLPNILPYSLQDGYQRLRREKSFRVAVLENDILRATFLLEMGGRLWSLYHKPSCRELLFVNPVFQPANLALRNAWFSGGVEWNIGTIGHTPFTCSPLFSARVEGPDTLPVLRLYEWERIRQVTFQLDAWLPEESPVLFIKISIRNPRNQDVPMYWWSNIAVPENPGTRVIVPAESAYRYTYDRLERISVPDHNGMDSTYPARVKRATDFFYHIPDGRLPWIAALDEHGCGLFQVSTSRLKGRKAFFWGMGAGGRNWQKFLSLPGQSYLEIQAGLARTQLEHSPMPPGSEWTWMEAYGLIETDRKAVHAGDWKRAMTEVDRAIDNLIPRKRLEHELSRGRDFADRPPMEEFLRGSGWGALERLRREVVGESPMCSTGLIFDDQSLTEEQHPWISLLNDGGFPEAMPDEPPRGFVVQSEWKTMLEKSRSVKNNWMARLHLGIMCFHQKDYRGARQAWEASLRLADTPWALRNLAVLDRQDNLFDAAAEKYLAACRMKPALLPLIIEAGKLLIETGFAESWLELLAELPEGIRNKGRIVLLKARAMLAAGNLEGVKDLISRLPVPEDIREGEVSLSQLWFDHQSRILRAGEDPLPLPQELDFRM